MLDGDIGWITGQARIFGCRSAGFPCSTVVRLDCRVAVGGILVVDLRDFHIWGSADGFLVVDSIVMHIRRFGHL